MEENTTEQTVTETPSQETIASATSYASQEAISSETAETDASSTLSIEPEQEKPAGLNKRLLAIFIAGLMIIGLISLLIYYLKNPGEKEPREELTPLSEEIKTSSPSAEIETDLESENKATKSAEKEAVAINLADYAIQILNGSGIVGEARKVRDKLEAEGFENFKTGNADNYDYVETEVSFKEKTLDSLLKIIKEALDDEYKVVQKKDLPKDSPYDVVVVIGTRID